MFRATRPRPLGSTASYVRSLGITIFSVGVGDADEDELRVCLENTSKSILYYTCGVLRQSV